MNRLKEKTNNHNIDQVRVEVDSVPPYKLSLYPNLTWSSEIMFDNKIPFLEYININIRYNFIVGILNRQVHAILKLCKILHNLYVIIGVLILVMKIDPEFNTLSNSLEQMKIHLNTTR